MKKKIQLASIIVIGILLIGYGIYNYLKPMAVETKTITLSEAAISFIETGIVKNTKKQYIYPLVSGKLEKVLAKKGDFVKAGDILATIDLTGTKYELKKLEKSVEGYKAQLDMAYTENKLSHNTLEGNKSNLLGQLQALKAQSNTEGQKELEDHIIDQSLKTYEQGIKDLNKYKELYNLGYIAEVEYQNFKDLVATYETNYKQSVVSKDSSDKNFEAIEKAIYAQINSIDLAYYQSLIAASQASIEELKYQQLNYAIMAKTDGIVSENYIENVNVVNSMEPAFLIQGCGELQIEVKVSTRDIDTMAVGDEVTLVMDRRSGDIELKGYIDHISPHAETAVSPLGIEERKVLVTIKPQANDYLGAGYDVDVKFMVYDGGKQLIVPNSAMFKKDQQDMVLLLKNNTVVEVPVEIGYELNGEVMIGKGIEEGDQIITDLDAKGLKVGVKAISSNELRTD